MLGPGETAATTVALGEGAWTARCEPADAAAEALLDGGAEATLAADREVRLTVRAGDRGARLRRVVLRRAPR